MPEAELLADSLTIRLPRGTLSELGQQARAARETPASLVRSWVLERLELSPNGGPDPAVLTVVRDRDGSPREALRAKYRPDDIVVLFVGESAPAGGTFFYQADSNLFSATREAFERAFGPMPEGAGFLEHFRDEGFWLWDIAERPVNQLPGRPRQAMVDAGVVELAALISELQPDFVIAVKSTLEGPVHRATQVSGFTSRRVRVLPFPVRQWRGAYVRDLSRFLNRDATSAAAELAGGTLDAERLTLHEAMQIVLADHAGTAMTARELANEIASRGLYERRDGGRAAGQQVLLRARKYQRIFAVGGRGIGLADEPG